MMTAEHYMYLITFYELLACQYYSSGELKFMLETYNYFVMCNYFDYNVSNLHKLEPG